MRFELLGYDVFFDFLLNRLLIIVSNGDDAVDVTVNVLLEYVFDLHDYLIIPEIDQIERTIVIVVKEFIEQNDGTAIIFPRIERNDRDVSECIPHALKKSMQTDERVDLPDARNDENVPRLMRLVIHQANEFRWGSKVLKGIGQSQTSHIFLDIADGVQNVVLFENLQENIVEIHHNRPKFCFLLK